MLSPIQGSTTWSFSKCLRSRLSSFLSRDACLQDAMYEDEQIAGADAVIRQHALNSRLQQLLQLRPCFGVACLPKPCYDLQAGSSQSRNTHVIGSHGLQQVQTGY